MRIYSIYEILFLNRIVVATVYYGKRSVRDKQAWELGFGFSLKVSFLVGGFNSTPEPPLEGETAIFLHGQEKIWKGLINMQSVAKFVTKAYLVSGSFEHLKEVSNFAWLLGWFFISNLIIVECKTFGHTCKQKRHTCCQCCAGFARHNSCWRTDISKHSVGLCRETENLALQG